VFAKKRILKRGEPAEATVLSVAERSHVTSNELRDYDHVLLVRPEDGALDALNAQTDAKRADVDDLEQQLIESDGAPTRGAGSTDPIAQLERLELRRPCRSTDTSSCR
jgi:hypothetical protein